MEWLNYHHLLYFWSVAKHGTVAKAGEELRLSQPTISAQQTVFEAKRLGVFTCQIECLLEQAAAHMVEEDVSALVVADEDGCLEGIFTRTDLLRAWVAVDEWEKQTVKDYMNSNVVTVTPEALLSEVAVLMLENQIHRVVVAQPEEGRQRPLSVVSAADLVYHMVNPD